VSWDDTKEALDDFLSDDWNDMVTDLKTRAVSSSGSGAPSSTPTNIGDIYVDTTNLKIYIATGTSSSADWKKVLSQ
jgi:hypothetical protein